MKKLLFLVAAMLVICLLAFSVCASEVSSSDEFGEATIITDNEAISKRSDLGYSEGDLSKVVLKIPGTETYVTYPAYYVLHGENRDNGYQPVPDFSDINGATGYTFDVTSIIRLEIPNVFNKISGNYLKPKTMTSLKSIRFQSNIVIIFSGAFSGLNSLEEVIFEDNLDSEAGLVIDKNTFENCKGLSSVRLPSHLTSIGERGFAGCTALTEITLNGKLTEVGTASFLDCTALKTVNVPENNSITKICHRAFDNCDALSGVIEFKKVTSIDTYAFRYCATNEDTSLVLKFPALESLLGSGDIHTFSYSGLKEIYIGESFGQMSFNSFTDCKRLEKIEIKGVKKGFNFPSYTFNGCSSLKAFSIPEGMTELPSRMFLNCSNLKAIYLPSTLIKINSGSQDHATFANCTNAYFVSSPFTFTSDEDIPEKPEVYYFPEGLTTLTGKTFKQCKSLNNTLVFPKGVTSMTNNWAFEAGISNPTLENIVFLGDMETVSASTWKFTGKIYFANANDRSSADLTLSGTSKVVFCNAENNTEHLFKVAVNTPATCTEKGVNGFKCFCGKESDEAEIIEALGHNKTTIVSVAYNGNALYFEKGDVTYTCDRCMQNHVVEGDADALFTAVGYSYTEASKMSKAIMQSFGINHKAIKTYNDYTEKDIVNFGVLAATENGLNGTSDVFGDDGNVNTAKVNVASYVDKTFDLIEMKLGGLEGKDGTSYEDAKLYCCAFIQIKNGEMVESYYATKNIDGATVSTALSGAVSYNDLIK